MVAKSKQQNVYMKEKLKDTKKFIEVNTNKTYKTQTADWIS